MLPFARLSAHHWRRAPLLLRRAPPAGMASHVRAAVVAPAFPKVQGHRGDVYAEPENTLAGWSARACASAPASADKPIPGFRV